MTPLALLVAAPAAAPAWAVLGAFGLCLLGMVYFGAGLLKGKK